MTYAPPSWMNAEDKAREAELVQLYRDIIGCLRDRLEKAEGTQDVLAWRWRTDAMLQEARLSLALLTPKAKAEPEAQLEKAHPPTKEASG